MTFGKVDISQIKTDPKSRDEIDKTVKGLQYIYVNIEIRKEVFKLLKENILPKVSKKTGRPGMELWKILVLGVIRQSCSWDYDKLLHAANYDMMIRELLGHDKLEWDDRYYYELQTVKDNVTLLTPELLDKLNEIVVKTGHNLLGGKKKAELHGSVDSFVLETDVHFPTDISLLYDSMRKAISLTAEICSEYKIGGWRQSVHNIHTIKNGLRKIQNIKRNKPLTDEKVQKAYRVYVDRTGELLTKVKKTLRIIEKKVAISPVLLVRIMEIEKYINYAEKEIDQIERRVFQGETIPHSEKIFSIFEPHTQWISKGKAGVPVEFGVPVSIMKDQYGYILEYEVMEKTNDVDVAVPLAERAKGKYPALKSSSFDKGFWSPKNHETLKKLFPTLVMPKKGKLNKAEITEESAEEFIKLRRKHSAVESSINGLNHSGLDKCYDHGIYGLKRCVGLSILARNLQTL
ncbi:MAG: ISNCY family transposase, partial [Candidatus Firestonebacteria bacterium]